MLKASQQALGTEAKANACHQLLDYVAAHPNAGIRYLASNMILAVYTDALYLSKHNTRSWVSAHFYLTLNLASTIKHGMSLASEAELAALYYGCKTAVPIQTMLAIMGHTQPTTPIMTDNITAQGPAVGTMTPKASKSMDQHFHSLKYHSAQCQFLYLWCHGILNAPTTPVNINPSIIKLFAHSLFSLC